MPDFSKHTEPKPHLVATIGLPASGKTAYAKFCIEADPDYCTRANRDSIRKVLFPNSIDYSQEQEDRVTFRQFYMIKLALRRNMTIYVDDTNVKREYLERLYQTAHLHDADFTALYFPLTVEESILRQSTRTIDELVPDSVILSMAKDLDTMLAELTPEDKKRYNFRTYPN